MAKQYHVLILLLCLSLFIGCDSRKNTRNTDLDSGFNEVIVRTAIDKDKQFLKPYSSELMPTVQKKYTVMIYMVGTDLESKLPQLGGGAASRDLQEIFNAGVNVDEINVLVYTGGASQWWTEGIPADKNAVFQLVDTGFQLVGYTDTYENTGDPQCLYDYINFSYSNYPANNYGLIFWDHGGGPVLGYGYDELYEGDGLLLKEMYDVMEASPFGADNHLRFVGFDACLMAGLEVADLWSNYADYMIAATEFEPGAGWDYGFMSIINDTEDGFEIAKSCIDAYDNYYAMYNALYAMDDESQELGIYNRATSTLSCMDLRAFELFMTKFDTLMRVLTENMDEVYPEIGSIRSNITRYGVTDSRDYDLIDLFDFINRLPDKYRNIVPQELMNRLVVYSKANISDSYGISLYMPYYWNELYDSSLYNDLYHEYNVSDAYREFLDAFVAKRFGKTEETIENLTINASHLEEAWFALDQEVINALSSLTCTILYSPNNDDNYIPIIQGILLSIDVNGNVFQPNQIVSIEPEGSKIPVSVKFLKEKNDKTSIAIGNLCLTGQGERMTICIRAEIHNDTGMLVLNDIMQETNDLIPLSKGVTLAGGWKNMEMEIKSIKPTYSKNNVLLPADEWGTGNLIWNAGIALDALPGNRHIFNAVSITELPGKVVAQVVLEDVYGNVSVSNLLSIK